MNFQAIQRLEQITERDLHWLKVGCKAITFRKISPAALVDRMLHGTMIMVRIVGENCEGIACLTPDSNEQELWIDLYAGRNVMTVELRDLFKKMAKCIGLKRLTGYVGRQALDRWYHHNIGARPVATLFIEELD